MNHLLFYAQTRNLSLHFIAAFKITAQINLTAYQLHSYNYTSVLDILSQSGHVSLFHPLTMLIKGQEDYVVVQIFNFHFHY